MAGTPRRPVRRTGPLADEDVAYPDALRRAGGQAEPHVRPGAFHGFDGLAPEATLGQDARDARTRRLRRALTRSANLET
ncbi:hypothetical protein ACGFYY_01320 [Streptomyces sp. NPDC048331]|uniref:hypothetical protein n=1 Tax=Streptomyces sp. NPDC048331 TaxID=3365534 RepID=UPI00371C74AF